MPNPETIREVLAKKREGAKKLKEPPRPGESAQDVRDREKYAEGFMDGLAYAEGRFEEVCILDYHIIPGAKCVVKDLGAAATAACDAFNEACDDESGEMTGQEAWLLAARAALEAAGITVCNEVAWVREAGNFACRDKDGRHDVLPLHTGDILFIKRKED